MLVVNANSPYKTLEEFIAGAKANPGKLKLVTQVWELFITSRGVNIERTTGTKFNHIPYNEGTGPSIAALVGDHIDGVLTTPGAVKSLIDAGILRVLGVMDERRFPLIPDVPTFKEALNLDTNVKMRAWAVLATTAGVPDNVKNELVGAFSEVVQNQNIKKH